MLMNPAKAGQSSSLTEQDACFLGRNYQGHVRSVRTESVGLAMDDAKLGRQEVERQDEDEEQLPTMASRRCHCGRHG